jgi:hypothetical protein
LYYCLTQHPPLDSEADRLPLLSLLKPGAQRLLRSGTHLNPDDRPGSADLWLAQLSKSRPAAVKVSPTAQIQAPIGTLLQEQEPIQVSTAQEVSTAPTYLLQDPNSTPLLRSPSDLPGSTQVQHPQTSIQTSIQNTTIQTHQESPRSVPIDQVKIARPTSALPENLPRYRTTPLMPSKTSKLDQNLAESMISERVSMKRLPLSEGSSDRDKYSRPDGSLFLPKLRTVQIIGAIGTILGLIFGLVLRFQASQRPGASFFHTGQSFPPREWKGTTSPNDPNGNVFVEPNTAPIAPESSSESAQPQPSPIEPAAGK